MKSRTNDFLYAGYSYPEEIAWKAKREELRKKEQSTSLLQNPNTYQTEITSLLS